ncbi:protein transport protein bet1 [Coemansia sp. RSA 518]|nr:protein transport protein bet1 [Coemansia sp. RSA 1591]KAJ1767165.1 protein transport protein bet1 [Coemansia sp. RSA 1752]KAJ1778627.1 protein transport protein bet1 [Coemansia sp. RSA 1824]KAJ1794691.1 protein transport protein bet1 [Coemansia sp. RSA 1938]KAJ2228810.1 protein transport protein bet1 [Coemansia sp. RSA 518]KAJ2251399.1 protein transport protein bet1 [Coemansia sp. RSA 454]KAJ2408553.1 protein transport protein bet1 [Coemansia sp. RSA 2526]KAJ2431764.1 protein transport p
MATFANNRQRNPGGFRSETSEAYGRYPPSGFAGEEEDDPNSKDARLKGRISMLKEVSISIGDEIRDQNQFLGTMGQDMEGMGDRLGATIKRFHKMWVRQGCGPFFYLTLFAIGVVVFLYIYLKMR